MLKVRLIQQTPDPERTVAAAARLCYSPSGVDEILEKLGPEGVERFLSRIRGLGHLSPFEHASFTFGVEGVSRICLNQVVRHRIASYSQQSQRYVRESQFDYVIPPSIEGNSEARAIFEEQMGTIQAAYNRLVALGIHQEDARYLLPGGCESKIVITMNARELLHFFELRTCQRAQWEIRRMAQEMLRLVKKAAPGLFADAGAPCIHRGICREGDLSCGLIHRLPLRQLPFMVAGIDSPNRSKGE